MLIFYFTLLFNLICMHTGSRAEIDVFEAHDTERSVFFIGENILSNALVNGHSNNTFGDSTIESHTGFMFYDTFVKERIFFCLFSSHEMDISIITKKLVKKKTTFF